MTTHIRRALSDFILLDNKIYKDCVSSIYFNLSLHYDINQIDDINR